MGVQKSQKGRQTAASETSEIGRRINRGPRNLHPGRQQFGGTGTVAALDRNVDSLSQKAVKAIEQGSNRPRKRGG
jgi:hypothetical protein